MEKYTVEFLCCDAECTVDISTNHSFVAKDEEEKNNIAASLESKIDKFLRPYYDKKSERIVVEITENELFDKAWISKFCLEDEKNDDVEMTEEEFVSYIQREYKTYLETYDILTFECVSYGVNPFPMNARELLLYTDIGDRWVNSEGVSIEHTKNGMRWEDSNELFSEEEAKDMRSHVNTVTWTKQMSDCRHGLLNMGYKWEEVRYWTEAECEKLFHEEMENSIVVENLNLEVNLEDIELEFNLE